MRQKSGYFFVVLMLLFAQISLRAQMQGQISQSSLRSIATTVEGAETVHVQNYNDSEVIGLCNIGGGNYCFFLTKAGSNNVQKLQFACGKIDNFKIVAGRLYFCGSNSGRGFVSYFDIDNAFVYGNMGYNELSIVNTCEVLDFEVYKQTSTGDYKVAAIGKDSSGSFYLLDYNMTNNSVQDYRAFKTPYILQAIAQTATDIDVVFTRHGNSYSFEVSRHDKEDLSVFDGMIYTYDFSGQIFNDNIRPCFLASTNGTDKLYVSTTIEGQQTSDYNTQGIETGVFTIDLANGLDLIGTQIVPTESKVFLKDMKYSPFGDKIYLLAFAYIGNGFGDNILELDMSQTGPYLCDCDVPNNSSYITQNNNSIALYGSDKYYIVAGVDTSGNLNYFDKYVLGNTPNCSYRAKAKVFSNSKHQYPVVPMYHPNNYPKNPVPGSFTPFSDLYNIYCFD